MIRAPPFRIVPVSAACINPSRVQSITTSASASAFTATVWPVSATEAPEDRITGPAGARGVGT